MRVEEATTLVRQMRAHPLVATATLEMYPCSAYRIFKTRLPRSRGHSPYSHSSHRGRCWGDNFTEVAHGHWRFAVELKSEYGLSDNTIIVMSGDRLPYGPRGDWLRQIGDVGDVVKYPMAKARGFYAKSGDCRVGGFPAIPY